MSDNILMGIEGLFLGPRDELRADRVPVHLRDGIRRYVEHGILPGSLLRAIICNNLRETICRAAGDLTLGDIRAVHFWFWDCAPGACYGSEDRMAMWHKQGGLRRVEA